MSRAISAPQAALLATGKYRTWARVYVEDHLGVLQDHTGSAYLVTYEETVDELVNAFSVSFRRGVDASSLAPLMTVHPPIKAGREVVLSTATLAIGAVPLEADFREVFRGIIDRTKWPGRRGGSLVIEGRDRIGAALADTYITAVRTYPAGMAREAVMQAIITDAGLPYTLHVPAPTGSVLSEDLEQGQDSVLSALRAIADSIAFTVRPVWSDADGEFQLTLFEPPRGKVDPDATFAPAQYYDVSTMEVDVIDVRNGWEVEYVGPTGELQTTGILTDEVSIAEYGGVLRYSKLTEGTDSPVRDETTAVALGSAALSDSAQPDADLEIVGPYWWAGQVGMDLYRFLANGEQFSADQDLAPTAIRHTIEVKKRAETRIAVRGKPSGGVLSWQRRAARAAATSRAAEDPAIFNWKRLYIKDEDADNVLAGLLGGSAVSVGWVYDITAQLPVTSPPVPAPDAKPTARIYRLEDGTFEYLAHRPPPGSKRWVYFVPRTEGLRAGDSKVLEVLPGQLPSEGIEDGAVTTPKIDFLAVTEAELAEAAVVRSKILIGAVDELRLADAAVTQAKVAVAAIDTTRLQDLAITAQKIADAAVSTVKIALAAIDTSRLADAAVVGAKIAAAALTVAHFAIGLEPVSVVAAVPGAKATSAIVNSTDGKLYRWNGSVYTAAVPAVDLTGQITSSQITDAAITTPKLMAGSVTTAVLAAGSVTANELAANSVVAGKISAGAISTAELAAGAVNASKIAAGSITSSEIAAGTITASNIAASTITGDRIAGNTIVGAKLVAGTITSSEIATATIVAANIASATITSGQIAASTITGANIAALTIQAGNLAADSVNASKIVAASITGDRLVALTITGDKISANAITADKISVATLSALSANLGTVTAGTISAGVVFAGELSAATGTFAGDLRLDSSIINKLSFRSAGTEYGYISAEVVSSAGVVSVYFSDSAVTPALRLLQGTGQFDRTLTVSGTVSAGGLQLGAGALGFFTAAGGTKKTVTGSRGGNAALASLLTQLADYGLITNSTSA